MATIRETRDIALTDLVFGKGQVRLTQPGKEIDELVDSIRVQGLLEPIVVCETDTPGEFEIITGQRRFYAHQTLGRDTIRATILAGPITVEEAKSISLTENLVRTDLSSTDLIAVCTELYRTYGSLKAVAEKTGLSANKVKNYVRYDRLHPVLKDLVDNDKVDIPTALRAQEAASVGVDDVNSEDAQKFALEMSSMSGPQAKKMVETRKADPSMSADEVIEDAKAGGKIYLTQVTLTSSVNSALDRYARFEGLTKDDAAGTLIREGLFLHNFLEDL
ncbi:MAG: ParB/RepB/Spo0J family partition protein [Caldilineaceae bacterium]|nr:ParB/RepB/Spo0J family partition protein [Caldilineaceae bacterium]